MPASNAAWWLSAAVAALALCAGTALAADDSPDAARLSNLLRQDCGACHGLTLKGGLGKPLTAEHLQPWSREQLTAIILEGVPGTPMPPWRALLSERDAAYLADLLKNGHPQ